MNAKVEKVKAESEAKEIKKPVEMEESNSEDETSFKSEVRLGFALSPAAFWLVMV